MIIGKTVQVAFFGGNSEKSKLVSIFPWNGRFLRENLTLHNSAIQFGRTRVSKGKGSQTELTKSINSLRASRTVQTERGSTKRTRTNRKIPLFSSSLVPLVRWKSANLVCVFVFNVTVGRSSETNIELNQIEWKEQATAAKREAIINLGNTRSLGHSNTGKRMSINIHYQPAHSSRHFPSGIQDPLARNQKRLVPFGSSANTSIKFNESPKD